MTATLEGLVQEVLATLQQIIFRLGISGITEELLIMTYNPRMLLVMAVLFRKIIRLIG